LEGRCVRCGAEASGLAADGLRLCDPCWELYDLKVQAEDEANAEAERAEQGARKQMAWWALLLPRRWRDRLR
jgi:hypothetical protein